MSSISTGFVANGVSGVSSIFFHFGFGSCFGVWFSLLVTVVPPNHAFHLLRYIIFISFLSIFS